MLKVISGGQSGVDQAALRSARACGLATGGLVPKGWLTEEGPAPWLSDYGLTEHTSPDYSPRTRANVDDAHATLIIAPREPLTGGTRMTYDYAYRRSQSRQSCAGLYVAILGRSPFTDCRSWLRECMAAASVPGGQPWFILNVAGPRELRCAGIGAWSEAWLLRVFDRFIVRGT